MWVKKLKAACKDIRDDESGATAVEYALLTATIAIAIIASTIILGNHIGEDLHFLGNTINGQELPTGQGD